MYKEGGAGRGVSVYREGDRVVRGTSHVLISPIDVYYDRSKFLHIFISLFSEISQKSMIGPHEIQKIGFFINSII